jgi:hypothetical protein
MPSIFFYGKMLATVTSSLHLGILENYWRTHQDWVAVSCHFSETMVKKIDISTRLTSLCNKTNMLAESSFGCHYGHGLVWGKKLFMVLKGKVFQPSQWGTLVESILRGRLFLHLIIFKVTLPRGSKLIMGNAWFLTVRFLQDKLGQMFL